MATRPTGSTTRGKYFAYPADAAGSVTPYWLASSPSANHRVRMTGACKAAFLATIEAAIERAVAPATYGNYPATGTDLKTVQLDTTDVNTLVHLRAWTYAARRAGLGAKLVRGCPQEEWERLVQVVADLWNPAIKYTEAGNVYAWQVSALDYDTSGWVDEGDLMDAGPPDLSFYVADESVAMGGSIELRLWGDYAGGAGGYTVAEWVANALISLSANISTPSWTPGGFADYELNGDPAPLAEGHEGNWFASTPSTMIGQSPSVRRSSSAWAVLQSMLANMRFTHLGFNYVHYFNCYRTTRAILRYVTMDDTTGDIVTVEESDTETTTFENETSDVSVSTSKSFTEGTASRKVQFFCNDSDAPALAVSVRPADGWSKLGRSLVPFLTFGTITTGGGLLELERLATTEISRITAGNMWSLYPAEGMETYIKARGKAHFIDREEYFEGSHLQWTKYSVRGEDGYRDLTVPVRFHAQWLLQQIPSMPFPNVPANPGTLRDATNDFWANWEVYYPATPNIQVNGQDAYFPTAFRNNTFAAPTDIQITHVNNAWESGSQYECVFGRGQMAFPGLDQIDYGNKSYTITPYNEAMMGVEWDFKAMTT